DLMLSRLDTILRFGAAMGTGSLIGIYLELHQKPTGIRTLGLVALASAVVVLAVAKDPHADASRVIQGVITGVGFLGAGVILHRGTGVQVVHGLSTAATIWITASLAYYVVSLLGNSWPLRSSFTVFLLIVGGVIENWARPLVRFAVGDLGKGLLTPKRTA